MVHNNINYEWDTTSAWILQAWLEISLFLHPRFSSPPRANHWPASCEHSIDYIWLALMCHGWAHKRLSEILWCTDRRMQSFHKQTCIFMFPRSPPHPLYNPSPPVLQFLLLYCCLFFSFFLSVNVWISLSNLVHGHAQPSWVSSSDDWENCRFVCKDGRFINDFLRSLKPQAAPLLACDWLKMWAI